MKRRARRPKPVRRRYYKHEGESVCVLTPRHWEQTSEAERLLLLRRYAATLRVAPNWDNLTIKVLSTMGYYSLPLDLQAELMLITTRRGWSIKQYKKGQEYLDRFLGQG